MISLEMGTGDSIPPVAGYGYSSTFEQRSPISNPELFSSPSLLLPAGAVTKNKPHLKRNWTPLFDQTHLENRMDGSMRSDRLHSPRRSSSLASLYPAEGLGTARKVRRVAKFVDALEIPCCTGKNSAGDACLTRMPLGSSSHRDRKVISRDFVCADLNMSAVTGYLPCCSWRKVPWRAVWSSYHSNTLLFRTAGDGM